MAKTKQQLAMKVDPKIDSAWWVLLAWVCIKCGAPSEWFFTAKLMRREVKADDQT